VATTARTDASPEPPVPALVDGERLTREEFMRRYEAVPELQHVQLLEGMVYMPSPIRVRHHGQPHGHLLGWLGYYKAATPGVQFSGNSTVRLDRHNVPEPDGMLWIEAACGGQSQVSADDYLEGAPELAAEIAASSKDRDLGPKFTVYQRNHVLEYLVWRVEEQRFDWYVLREGRYELLPPDAAGIYHSEVFPGLWLDAAALLRGDLAQVFRVLQQGLDSPEHAAFVARLAQRAAGG
jgi:Uma2 family endonuclease